MHALTRANALVMCMGAQPCDESSAGRVDCHGSVNEGGSFGLGKNPMGDGGVTREAWSVCRAGGLFEEARCHLTVDVSAEIPERLAASISSMSIPIT